MKLVGEAIALSVLRDGAAIELQAAAENPAHLTPAKW
jgi:hypothetical protein